MAIITLADTLLHSVLFGNAINTANSNTIKAIDDAKLNTNEIFKLLLTTVEISDTEREKDFVLGFIAQNQNSFTGGEVQLEKIPMIRGQFTDTHVFITVVALKKVCTD